MTHSPRTHAATPGTQPRSSCPPPPPAPSAGLSCAPAAARAWLPPGFRVPSTSGAGEDVPWHSRLARSHRRPGIRLPLLASGVGGRPEGLRPRTRRDAVPGGTPGCTGRHRACLVSPPHRGGPWTQDGGPVGWPAAGDEALCAHSCRHGAAWRGWVPRRAHTLEPCSPPPPPPSPQPRHSVASSSARVCSPRNGRVIFSCFPGSGLRVPAAREMG